MSDNVHHGTNNRRLRLSAESLRLLLPPRRPRGVSDSSHGADRVKASIHLSSDRRLSPDRSAGISGPPPPFRRGPDLATDRIFFPPATPVSFAKPTLKCHAIRYLTGPRCSRVSSFNRPVPAEKYRPAKVENGGRPCYCPRATVASTKRVQRLSAGVGPSGRCKCSRAVFAKNTETRRHSGEPAAWEMQQARAMLGDGAREMIFYLGESK